MQDFRQLQVWHRARDLTLEIRALVAQFPPKGYGSLRNQMIRSAESIADNIVEGCGAATNPEFARFLDIAIKSATELEGQLDRGHHYGVIAESRALQLQAEVVLVRKQLHALRKRVIAAH